MMHAEILVKLARYKRLAQHKSFSELNSVQHKLPVLARRPSIASEISSATTSRMTIDECSEPELARCFDQCYKAGRKVSLIEKE